MIRASTSGSMPTREVRHDVVETDLRQDRDAVPLALPVVGRLVAQRRERQRRERVVGDLRLLQAHDVGLDLGEPLLDTGHGEPSTS